MLARQGGEVPPLSHLFEHAFGLLAQGSRVAFGLRLQEQDVARLHALGAMIGVPVALVVVFELFPSDLDATAQAAEVHRHQTNRAALRHQVLLAVLLKVSPQLLLGRLQPTGVVPRLEENELHLDGLVTAPVGPRHFGGRHRHPRRDPLEELGLQNLAAQVLLKLGHAHLESPLHDLPVALRAHELSPGVEGRDLPQARPQLLRGHLEAEALRLVGHRVEGDRAFDGLLHEQLAELLALGARLGSHALVVPSHLGSRQRVLPNLGDHALAVEQRGIAARPRHQVHQHRPAHHEDDDEEKDLDPEVLSTK